ncbi:MAG: flavodoxin family protein [Spirochaetia bacterium]|nr:flavodoxin family protein [Spirochaetia bacterium]
MNILMINGSPHADGNTALALAEMKKIFDAEKIETTLLQIGNKDIHGCVGCGTCYKNGKCVFDDEVNKAAELFEKADGLVIGSPVYYASPNGTLISFLDRLFFSTQFDKTMKVGAAVAVARRGGCTAAFDVLNKYLSISGMAIASSQYWNIIHGRAKGEAAQDAEGLQTMRVLARNMVFMLRSIALGKEKYGLPETEPWTPTNFIR